MSYFKLLLLLFISFPAVIHAQNIIEYRCSDSAYQSSLIMSDSGLVTINESCFDACLLHTYKKSYNLSGNELLEILNIINNIRSGQLQQMAISGNIIKRISCTGELRVFGEGGLVIVKAIEIPLYSNMGTFTFNTSPASVELEQWVNRQVKQKIAQDILTLAT